MATQLCQKCKQAHPGRVCDYDEKVNAPRRSTPMRLLSPVTHHQKTKSAYVPEINPEAGSPRYLSDLQLDRLTRVNERYGDLTPTILLSQRLPRHFH